jgi:hypothetical protein
VITGRVSVKQLFGDEHRVVGFSDHDVEVVNRDRHGQVATLPSHTDLSYGQFGQAVESVANYLYRV